MVNSGATLVRGLRKILEGMPGVGSYIDDIVIYSDSWEDHLQTLNELFGRPPEERKGRTYPVERGTGACVFPIERIPVAGASPEASRFQQAGLQASANLQSSLHPLVCKQVCVMDRRIRSWCGGCATSGKRRETVSRGLRQ